MIGRKLKFSELPSFGIWEDRAEEEMECYGVIMNKDFVGFKKYFKGYQQLFGLTGYQVYFKYEPLESCFSDITVMQNDMIATVRLNSKLPDEDKPFKDVKRSAKHEALHLLLFRLTDRACSRYVLREEICEAIEEVVFKLEKLIDD